MWKNITFLLNNPFKVKMIEKDIINKLLPYKSGGNYLMLYKVIKQNSNKNICSLTQEELADLMQKSRRFISHGLGILTEINLIKFSYKKIEILKEVLWKKKRKLLTQLKT